MGFGAYISVYESWECYWKKRLGYALTKRPNNFGSLFIRGGVCVCMHVQADYRASSM